MSSNISFNKYIYDAIINNVATLLDDSQAYNTMSQAVNPYGDGKACPRIVEHLKNNL